MTDPLLAPVFTAWVLDTSTTSSSPQRRASPAKEMPDCGLRRLQRRFHQSGLPCDEARWLHGRLRAGDVTVEQVELAAYAGHPPSRLFLHAPAEPPQALSAWVRSLPRNRYREAALARAAIAAVNAALGSSCPPFTPDFPLSRHPGEVLHAAEQVLDALG